MQVKQQTTAIVDGKTTSQKVSVLIEENNNGNSLVSGRCQPHLKVITCLPRQLPFHDHFYLTRR